MAGRLVTSLTDIGRHMAAKAEETARAMVYALTAVGEECVNEARTNGSYNDITGNLRSSIGYAVIRDGRAVTISMADKTKDGEEGREDGQKFLQERIAKASRKGIVLVVTAGMQYAEYVEARGRVVLSGAEGKGREVARDILTSLGFTIK